MHAEQTEGCEINFLAQRQETVTVVKSLMRTEQTEGVKFTLLSCDYMQLPAICI